MIDQLTALVPDVDFVSGKNFSWSPREKRITYRPDSLSNEGLWALLHETGHAMLGHLDYHSDYELLKMEVDAWEKAKKLAIELGIHINNEHIEQCLDSYRDWLYRRSICPSCGTKTIQKDNTNNYSCFNCHAQWQVSPSRFCRAYRTLRSNSEITLT